MKLFVISFLVLTSSIGFAGPRYSNVDDNCYVNGASMNQVTAAKDRLNTAGQGLLNAAGGVAKSLAAIERVTKSSELSQENYDYSKIIAIASVKQDRQYLAIVAAGCEPSDILDFFNTAEQILTTATNGLKK